MKTILLAISLSVLIGCYSSQPRKLLREVYIVKTVIAVGDTARFKRHLHWYDVGEYDNEFFCMICGRTIKFEFKEVIEESMRPQDEIFTTGRPNN